MRRLGEILDEVVPEVCGELSLADMPANVRALVDERDGCWIDRAKARGGRFSYVWYAYPYGAKGEGGRRGETVTIRRATMQSAGREWKVQGRYQSLCGDDACVHPDHIAPSADAPLPERTVERVRFGSTRELCRVMNGLLQRGFRPSGPDSGRYTKYGEFRVLVNTQELEYRDHSNAEAIG